MKIPQCSGLLLIACAIVWPAQEEVASARRLGSEQFRSVPRTWRTTAGNQGGVMAITSAQRYGMVWYGMVWYGDPKVWSGMILLSHGLGLPHMRLS